MSILTTCTTPSTQDTATHVNPNDLYYPFTQDTATPVNPNDLYYPPPTQDNVRKEEPS
jgi:hypothetical protein